MGTATRILSRHRLPTPVPCVAGSRDGFPRFGGGGILKEEAGQRRSPEKPAEARRARPLIQEYFDMDWRDRITVDPKVLTGKPVVKGTRIAVEFVVELLGRGWTVERILHEYDHLAPEDVQACLAYAGDVLKSERVYSMPT